MSVCHLNGGPVLVFKSRQVFKEAVVASLYERSRMFGIIPGIRGFFLAVLAVASCSVALLVSVTVGVQGLFSVDPELGGLACSVEGHVLAVFGVP